MQFSQRNSIQSANACESNLKTVITRLLDRRGHSLSQHTQFLKMRMIFFYETLIHSIEPTRSHLARFARARFALRAHENLKKKKCVSIDSKCSETHTNVKKMFTALTHYALRA